MSLLASAQRPRTSVQPALPSSTTARLTIVVTDENGVAVASANVALGGSSTGAATATSYCVTDYAGRCSMRALRPGTYSLRVEKSGFYRMEIPQVRVGQTDTIETRITHLQEIKETVEVQESIPPIDAERTADVHTLTTIDVLNVPYPTSRDIRQALPLLPGIVRDQSGNVHVGGASITQTLNVLDGFNIGAPSTSFGDIHVNADAVRTIDAETARFSAEYGKGTSVLGMGTGIGDDRFRFAATNFVPSFQLRRGLSFNQWVPRATASGPIKKGRAWFFVAPDAEYDQTIVKELPEGADRTHSWKVSNLAKVQVNITPANIISTELLVNSFHAENAGLSQFNPLETTQNQRATSWMAALRDQHYFHSGALVEAGLAVTQFDNSSYPIGDVPYVLRPGKTEGSFFETSTGTGRRVQFMGNAFFSPVQWHGRHEVKVGADFNTLRYVRDFRRNPIFMTRADGTLVRESTFIGGQQAHITNLEASTYGQDRWSPAERLLVEYGLRLDWDRIIGSPLLSPRVAGTYSIGSARKTKLSAGVGVFYQATNLDLVSQDRSGIRRDTFFAGDGVTPVGSPVTTSFTVDRSALREPRFVTLSLGAEHELPHAIYARVDFTEKRGNTGFVFLNSTPNARFGTYNLTNQRSTRYDSVTFTARHTFHQSYPVFASYTRSRAHTNSVFDFTFSTPVIGPQQDGPLSWDTPNRVLTWGWAPFFKKTLLGYAVEWHNGFPFTAVDHSQEVAGRAQSYRFPDYFSLTLSLEKRFHLMGYFLALRGTVENVTSNSNPTFVDNNVDSPHFLTFGGTGHRAATARIRFLGRKGQSNQNRDLTSP